MGNKPKNLNNRQVITILLVTMVLAITAILFSTTTRKKNSIQSLNPEILRSIDYAQVEDDDDIVDGTSGHVRFDAFFLRDLDGDGYVDKERGELLRGTCREIGGQDTLMMELNVLTAGTLKDAKIQIDGKNFYLQTTLPKDRQLKDNYIGNNIKQLAFNEIQNGTQKTLMGIVRSGDYSYGS